MIKYYKLLIMIKLDTKDLKIETDFRTVGVSDEFHVATMRVERKEAVK